MLCRRSDYNVITIVRFGLVIYDSINRLESLMKVSDYFYLGFSQRIMGEKNWTVGRSKLISLQELFLAKLGQDSRSQTIF